MILIRCDVSASIGWGHLKRCLSLAQQIKEYDEITFALKEYSDAAKKSIVDYGFCYITIPKAATYSEEVYRLQRISDKIVVDLFHQVYISKPNKLTAYLQTLDRSNFKIALINGLGAEEYRERNAPMVVANIQPYWGVEPGAELKSQYRFNGIKASVVDQCYRQVFRLRNCISVKKILVTFGGSDLAEITMDVLQAISRINTELSVRCIVGPSFSKKHLQKLKYYQDTDFAEFYFSPSDLASHFEWADLAICGSGVTRYEAAAAGLPVIFTAIHEGHDALSQDFTKYGTSYYIGVHSQLSVEDWSAAIKFLRNSPDQFQRMVAATEKMRLGKNEETWLGRRLVEVFYDTK